MTTEKRSTPWAAHPAALLLGAALLSGCATGPNANPADPPVTLHPAWCCWCKTPKVISTCRSC